MATEDPIFHLWPKALWQLEQLATFLRSQKKNENQEIEYRPSSSVRGESSDLGALLPGGRAGQVWVGTGEEGPASVFDGSA